MAIIHQSRSLLSDISLWLDNIAKVNRDDNNNFKDLGEGIDDDRALSGCAV